MPVMIARPEIVIENVFDRALSVVYFLDQPRNLFPSMHCMFSWRVTRELIDMESVRTFVKIGACVFSLLVFASTLFTRQHYIVDILGGTLVAELARFVSHGIEKMRNPCIED